MFFTDAKGLPYRVLEGSVSAALTYIVRVLDDLSIAAAAAYYLTRPLSDLRV